MIKKIFYSIIIGCHFAVNILWAQVLPPIPSSATTTSSTTPTNSSLEQMITTQTAQGMQIFQGVSYQSFSQSKQDFFSNAEQDEQNRHIKIVGS